jgi:hypothetical protein
LNNLTIAALISVLTITLIFGLLYETPTSEVTLISSTGNLMWYNGPASTTNGQNTSISYMTSKAEIVVSQITADDITDIRTEVVDKYHYLDDHGAPILHHIDGGLHEGKKLLIYNLHNSPIYSRISASQNSIEDWSDKTLIINCECTYPRLIKMRDQLLLFFRKQTNDSPITRSYFVISSDDYGATWKNERELITANPGEWIYAFPYIGKLKGEPVLGIVWGQHGRQLTDVQDIYVATSLDDGHTWSSIDGSVKRTVLRSDKQYQLHHSQDNHASRAWDVTTSSNGEPIILWIDYTDEIATAFYSTYSSHDGWSTTFLGENSRAYYPCGGALDRRNPSFVYLSKYGASNTVSNIVKLSVDASRRTSKKIASIPNSENLFLCRPMALEPGANFELLFTAVHDYKSFMNFDTSLHAYRPLIENKQ